MRYLDFVYQPRRDADGNITGIIVLGIDVTENRRAEQLLLQSEKLNAVGRLASSIAHEINNPLAAVTNLIYLAQQAALDPEAQAIWPAPRSSFAESPPSPIRPCAFTASPPTHSQVTATELIDATVPLYQGRLMNAHVKVETSRPRNSIVTCFEGEILQVLSNLIGNAIDAMSLQRRSPPDPHPEGTDWRTGRKGIVLTVADTGYGMSPHTLARIFVPFFTTKEHKGNGIGLWISRGIVDRHRGRLTVRSRSVTSPTQARYLRSFCHSTRPRTNTV